jgi:diadenosine tetraphosphate (Ap4A) HIT family hydrolase
VGIGLISGAILGESGILYELDKLIYLGAPGSARHMIFFSRGDAGLSSLEKLRSAVGVRIGAESVGHSGYIQGRIFAWLLGLREPRFVTGYAPTEIDVGLIRGEMDAHATNADAIAQRNSDWIEKKLMHFHAIMPVPKGVKHPRFADVPDLDTFAGTEQERRLLAMHRALWLPGQPFIAPPGVPKERVKILQEELDGARRYFELKERCVFSDIIDQETGEGQGRRVVSSTARYIALAPFAPRFPFETWILPVTRRAAYYTIDDDGEMMELAGLLKDTLGRLNAALDSPPYNIVLHTAPLGEPDLPYFHWHLEIMPKLTRVAGFEIGSGFYINPTPPEDAAQFLRDVGARA